MLINKEDQNWRGSKFIEINKLKCDRSQALRKVEEIPPEIEPPKPPPEPVIKEIPVVKETVIVRDDQNDQRIIELERIIKVQ